MASSAKGERFYYGWKIVFCGFLCLFFGQVLYTNCAGAYTAAITEEFGFSRSSFTLYLSISSAVMMISSPFIGRLLERGNTKVIMVVLQIVQALCYLGFTVCTELRQFYCFAVGLGLGFAGVIRLAPAILVNFWFGPKLRGRAMAFVTAGSGIGALTILPLITKIITTYGWRYGYYTAAAILIFFVTPCFLFIVSTPEKKGIAKRGEYTEEEKSSLNEEKSGMQVQQALKTPEFVCMVVAMLLLAIAATGLLTNVQVYLTDLGYDPTTAAAYTAVASGLLTVGKFVLGFLADKFGLKSTTNFAIGTFVFVFLCLFFTSYWGPAVFGFVAIYGIGGSIAVFLPPLITARIFGNRDYGAIYGSVNLASGVGTTIGPVSVALIFDITGSYKYAWLGIAALVLVAGIAFYLAMALAEKRQMKAARAAVATEQ